MKGLNTLTLNDATVRAALQLYLDQVLFRDGAAPEVTALNPKREGSNYGDYEYALTVKERAPACPSAISAAAE